MESLAYSVGGFLVALGILVTVHEFGHFWVARRLGVRVLRFSVGFGKPLMTRTAQDGTEYVLAAIPLGGYVKMLDEGEGNVAPEELPRAFNRQALWKRVLIVLAGPGFNFIFAVFAYALVHAMGVQGIAPEVGQVARDSIADRAGVRTGDFIVAIDGRANRSWSDQRLYLLDQALAGDSIELSLENPEGANRRSVSLDLSTLAPSQVDSAIMEAGLGLFPWFPEVPAAVGSVQPGSPADLAGIRTGDRILAIDGNPIANWNDLVTYVAARPAVAVAMEVERTDGTVQTIETTTRADQLGERRIGRLGIGRVQVDYPPERIVTVETGLVQALGRGIETTWLMSTVTVRMLWHMLRLEISSENLSGPITIAQFAGQAAQVGVDRFILLLAVISVSLGILNLLPIPMLDGGHLLYYLIEALRGKPLSEAALIRGQQIGIVLLAGLMCLAFYNDIVRWFL